MARKILLADDSVTAQNMGRKILADAGYEVITVNNGSAALKRIGEQHPDVIVLDVYMPGYSGLEVCQRLKEVGDTARIPILLTVGKLEPFKPEEAKRVRADGFIVKPFEASELLSALTRLEDKIVPRSESSKPGRFGRIAAAMEDGRFDKTMSVDEDSGWKNRISFPKKKKEPEAEEPEGNSAPSDVRAVIEKTPAKPASVTKPEEKVDLGALATEGLPKDVTPEEIAALAAAAARMKGTAAEEKRVETASEMPVVPAPELPPNEEPAAVAAAQPPAIPAEATVETQQLEPEVAAESKAAVSTAPEVEPKPEPESVTAAIAPLLQTTNEPASEPVTMAVAAAVGESVSHASRWMAVAVPLAPEDTGISLEQEMQKARAAYADLEIAQVAEASMTGTSVSSPEASAPEVAFVTPEAAESFTAVAAAADEAVQAAVKELENVASAFTAQAPAVQEAVPSVPSDAVGVPLAETAPAKSEIPSETTAIEAQPASTAESASAHVEEVAQPAAPAQDFASVPPVSEMTAGVSEIGAEKVSEAAAQGSGEMVSHPSTAESPAPQDTAAMAAAVGGKPIEDLAASTDADPAIASIVDSVLANLRPKIVEEISRKLGKK